MLAKKIENILYQIATSLHNRTCTVEILSQAISNLNEIAQQVRYMEINSTMKHHVKTKKSISILRKLHVNLVNIDFPTDGINYYNPSDNDNKSSEKPSPDAA